MLRLGASRDNGNVFLCQKPKKYLDRSFMEYSNRKKKTKRGRKPIGIETMLRMYLITFERQGTIGRGSDKCAFYYCTTFLHILRVPSYI